MFHWLNTTCVYKGEKIINQKKNPLIPILVLCVPEPNITLSNILKSVILGSGEMGGRVHVMTKISPVQIVTGFR